MLSKRGARLKFWGGPFLKILVEKIIAFYSKNHNFDEFLEKKMKIFVEEVQNFS